MQNEKNVLAIAPIKSNVFLLIVSVLVRDWEVRASRFITDSKLGSYISFSMGITL